jgi:hypothetical protein
LQRSDRLPGKDLDGDAMSLSGGVAAENAGNRL